MLALEYKSQVIEEMAYLMDNPDYDQVKIFDYTNDHLNLVANTKIIEGGHDVSRDPKFLTT